MIFRTIRLKTGMAKRGVDQPQGAPSPKRFNDDIVEQELSIFERLPRELILMIVAYAQDSILHLRLVSFEKLRNKLFISRFKCTSNMSD